MGETLCDSALSFQSHANRWEHQINNGPQTLVVAPDGTIYVSDTGNNRVLAITCPAWPG